MHHTDIKAFSLQAVCNHYFSVKYSVTCTVKRCFPRRSCCCSCSICRGSHCSISRCTAAEPRLSPSLHNFKCSLYIHVTVMNTNFRKSFTFKKKKKNINELPWCTHPPWATHMSLYIAQPAPLRQEINWDEFPNERVPLSLRCLVLQSDEMLQSPVTSWASVPESQQWFWGAAKLPLNCWTVELSL